MEAQQLVITSVQSGISDSSSQGQGLTCGGLAGTTMLFQSAEDCCTQMVPWVATATCVAESIRKFPPIFLALGLVIRPSMTSSWAMQQSPVICLFDNWQLSYLTYVFAIGFITTSFWHGLTRKWWWSAPYQFDGTDRWYVSYTHNKCVKDCPVGGSQCGGVITDSYVTLFDDANTCCSQKMWWLEDCVSSSLAG